MATVDLAGGVITIERDSWKWFWTGRARHSVPPPAIRRATVADEPLRAPRGARRGPTVSGRRTFGVGVLLSDRQLVPVTRSQLLDRSSPDGPFDEVIVAIPAADHLVRAITVVGA
ncbi:hypothetical protein AB0H00_09560 [Nocardia sp. NPDC023852]|uniref:hypothetical protein n=1 Tax=Nocardia sp. NPDC023852 TaxID=3154697 RepID=UPI003404B648